MCVSLLILINIRKLVRDNSGWGTLSREERESVI